MKFGRTMKMVEMGMTHEECMELQRNGANSAKEIIEAHNKKSFAVRIVWADGKQLKQTIRTKWNYDQVRAWMVRKFPDCQYIYMNEGVDLNV